MYSLITLVISYLVFLTAYAWESVPYFELMTVLIGLHGYVAVTSTSANLLYILRYFLVWILIILTAFVWYWFDGEVFVAPFGVTYQTAENTRLLVLAGTFSLCGSLMGWHVALMRFKYRRYANFELSGTHRKLIKIGGMVLAVSAALLYVWKAGGIVGGGKVYSDGQKGFDLDFNIFNILHYTGISLLLLVAVRGLRIQKHYLIFAILTLILGMLVGSRADYLPQAFVLLMLIYNQQVVEIFAKRQYVRLMKAFLLVVAVLIAGYFAASFIAIWRYGVSPENVLKIMFESDRGLLIREQYGHKMLWIETGNMMLGGAYSAIVQVNEGITGFLYGQSYVDYLLKAPPAFLGLPRPEGLEHFTAINGQIMSQGGIFEVAEGYWNFGILGCVAISFLISYAFGWLLKRGLRYNSYFFLTWYLVFGFMGVRAVWYQNFSYFRIMTVMLILYVAASVAFKWFVSGTSAPQVNQAQVAR
ncbi:MAG: hypothetical protein AB8G18_04675 [Gammaproteobacteria bacterium]